MIAPPTTTTTTNKDQAALSKAGKFRQDLCCRMAVTELQMPSLASRGPEEINEMFEYFLDEIHKRHPEKNRLKVDNSIS